MGHLLSRQAAAIFVVAGLALVSTSSATAQQLDVRRDDPPLSLCGELPPLIYDTTVSTPDSLRATTLPRLRHPYPLPGVYVDPATGRPVEGDGVFEFVVDSSGDVIPCSVRTVSASNAAFMAAALPKVPLAHFTPGTREGRPVATRVRQRITWRMRH